MGKMNFDHENTNALQRLGGVMALAIFSIFFGLALAWGVIQLDIPRTTAVFVLGLYLGAELFVRYWNNHASWSGAQ